MDYRLHMEVTVNEGKNAWEKYMLFSHSCHLLLKLRGLCTLHESNTVYD